VPITNHDVALDGATAVLRGVPFRLWAHRPAEGRIKSGNFSQDALGRRYGHRVYEVERSQSAGRTEVGVDLGLRPVAKCSDGAELEQARFSRDLEAKRGQTRREKRRRQVLTIHAGIASRRRDGLHKFSRALVDRAGKITVGTVSASAMAKTGMAKSVLDAGWWRLRDYLRYKCDHAGVADAEVDEASTTQACSACGCIGGPKGRAGLAIRRWTCGGCGADHDRDQNAARNIARLGCETPCPPRHGSSAF